MQIVLLTAIVLFSLLTISTTSTLAVESYDEAVYGNAAKSPAVAAAPATVAAANDDHDALEERRAASRLTRYPQSQFSSVGAAPNSAYQRRRQKPRVSTAEEQASLITGTYGLSGPPLKSVGSSAYEAADAAAAPYQSDNVAPYQEAPANTDNDTPYGQQQQAYTSPPVYQPPKYQSTTSTPYAAAAANYQCDQCKSSCSLVSKPSCPYGDGWFQYRDSCYYFERLRQLPWLQARGFCSLLTDMSGLHRGHLVIINDIKEQQFLGSVAQRLVEYGYPDRYWTDGVLDGFEISSILNGTVGAAINPTNWEWFSIYSLGDSSYYRPNITVVDNAANAYCVRVNVNNPNNRAPVLNGTVPVASTMLTNLFYENESCLDTETPLCEIQLDGSVSRR